jgi:hypothetical protein
MCDPVSMFADTARAAMCDPASMFAGTARGGRENAVSEAASLGWPLPNVIPSDIEGKWVSDGRATLAIGLEFSTDDALGVAATAPKDARRDAE